VKTNIFQLISNYDTSLFTKVFLFLRWISAPFKKMETLCPQKGLILDIGCGHGLFDLFLIIKSKNRIIYALDPDKKKATPTRALNKKINNIFFFKNSFKNFSTKEKFDAILLIDLLYLLSSKEKRSLLEKAKTLLKPNGKILIKTINYSPTFKFLLCYLQEFIFVKLLKFTFSETKKLSYYSLNQHRNLFNNYHFKIKKEIQLKTIFFHPHYLFILKK